MPPEQPGPYDRSPSVKEAAILTHQAPRANSRGQWTCSPVEIGTSAHNHKYVHVEGRHPKPFNGGVIDNQVLIISSYD